MGRLPANFLLRSKRTRKARPKYGLEEKSGDSHPLPIADNTKKSQNFPYQNPKSLPDKSRLETRRFIVCANG
jgi:hypothetical protein